MSTMVSKLIANAETVKRFIKENPGTSFKTLTNELRIKPGSLYHILNGLLDDSDICDGTQYKIMREDAPLSVAEVQAEIAQKKTGQDVSPVERIIFLYKPPAGLIHHSDRGFQYAKN